MCIRDRYHFGVNVVTDVVVGGVVTVQNGALTGAAAPGPVPIFPRSAASSEGAR